MSIEDCSHALQCSLEASLPLLHGIVTSSGDVSSDGGRYRKPRRDARLLTVSVWFTRTKGGVDLEVLDAEVIAGSHNFSGQPARRTTKISSSSETKRRLRWLTPPASWRSMNPDVQGTRNRAAGGGLNLKLLAYQELEFVAEVLATLSVEEIGYVLSLSEDREDFPRTPAEGHPKNFIGSPVLPLVGSDRRDLELSFRCLNPSFHWREIDGWPHSWRVNNVPLPTRPRWNIT